MIVAWIGAVVVGLSLGLLGSGGSILTLPILIYLVGQPEKVAIADSLAIVGGIALVGMLNYARQGYVSWRFLLLFGLPGIAGTYAGVTASGHVAGAVQLVVFAVIMGLSSYSMIKPSVARAAHEPGSQSVLVLVASGTGVGVITGFVGVGGGFLLLPALVILGNLSMQRAVGTSLAIIVLNSSMGFYRHVALLQSRHIALDWRIIIIFLVLGVAGSFAGNFIAHRIPDDRLRKMFGWFLVPMCLYILWRSLPQVI